MYLHIIIYTRDSVVRRLNALYVLLQAPIPFYNRRRAHFIRTSCGNRRSVTKGNINVKCTNRFKPHLDDTSRCIKIDGKKFRVPNRRMSCIRHLLLLHLIQQSAIIAAIGPRGSVVGLRSPMDTVILSWTLLLARHSVLADNGQQYRRMTTVWRSLIRISW